MRQGLLVLVSCVVFSQWAHASNIFTNKKPRSIYGPDNRTELDDKTHSGLVLDMARSVAAMIPKDKISCQKEHCQLQSKKLKEKLRLCEGERFADQPALAECTGFLVAPNVLVTAGHCVKETKDCANNQWVFEWGLNNHDKVESSRVYSCKKVIGRETNRMQMIDYAVVELDRDVVDRDPLEVRLEGEVAFGDELIVMGHPSGVPLKIADSGFVIGNSQVPYFSATLDTFGGNSGSPIFNKTTGVVEGILVRGQTDYRFDHLKKCARAMVYRQDDDKGEQATRIRVVKEAMELLGGSPVEVPVEEDDRVFDLWP